MSLCFIDMSKIRALRKQLEEKKVEIEIETFY